MDRSFAVRPVARDGGSAARAAGRRRGGGRFTAIVACLVLVLAACDLVKQSPSTPSGSQGSTGQPASKVVGPAGGAIAGPAGTQIVIPPGALLADTTIAIEETSAGAPPLPTEFSPFGPMFAFTPHGTTFAVPVTVTVPFDAASLPSGETPTLYKTNAQNQWEQVTGLTINSGTVSGQVTSFSLFAPGVAKSGVERRAPQREWYFLIDREPQPIRGNDLDRPAWEELHERQIFEANVIQLDDNRETTLEVFSSASGITFWASAEDVGEATLTQTQGFIKRAENATLQFVITAAVLEAVDFNHEPSPDECPRGVDDLTTCSPMHADIEFQAQAVDGDWKNILDRNGAPALSAHGSATLNGRAGSWAFETPDYGWAQRVWTKDDFDFVEDLNGSSGKSHPRAQLSHNIVIDVDLSELEVNDKFYVVNLVAAAADNKRARESAVRAFLRDPAKAGGTVMNITGLEQTNEPLLSLPPSGPLAPTPCTTGPDPAAGVLQFATPTFSVLERHFAGPDDIVVTRTQGSKGPVSATFSTAGGSATPGAHYAPSSVTVQFADGDTRPRTVPLDILENDVAEPDRTVNVTLSEPGGCASLGLQSTAVLTILDDDGEAVRPSTFTVGGTVNGLIGRLVLENHRGLLMEVTEDGPFTFSDIPTPSGEDYFVKVFNQPFAPVQHCTVTNGSGTFTDHNVTDVQVDCV